MRRVFAQLAVVALLLAGCAAGAPASPSPPSQPPDAASPSSPTALPTQLPGSSLGPTAGGPALVYGEMTCERTSWKSRMEGDNEILLERFSCRYAMNDPRLDGGQFEADVTTTIEPGDAPAARWVATATITNQGGSWSGPARGAVVSWDTDEPWNYWEASFTGSGAYEGLIYHELGAGSNAVATVTGSIEPAE